MWVLALALRISDFVGHVCCHGPNRKQEIPSFTNIGVLLIKDDIRLSGPGEKIHERA